MARSGALHTPRPKNKVGIRYNDRQVGTPIRNIDGGVRFSCARCWLEIRYCLRRRKPTRHLIRRGRALFLPEDAFRAAGITQTPRDQISGSADRLFSHMPLTRETRHMIAAAALARMPLSAILINWSRNGLVDEAALAQALTTGQLPGAGPDVFEIKSRCRQALLCAMCRRRT